MPQNICNEEERDNIILGADTAVWEEGQDAQGTGQRRRRRRREAHARMDDSFHLMLDALPGSNASNSTGAVSVEVLGHKLELDLVDISTAMVVPNFVSGSNPGMAVVRASTTTRVYRLGFAPTVRSTLRWSSPSAKGMFPQ
jgi:hypothetical protein